MACVTLKRPLEWIDPSMSPESGSSSPTNMIISNSPPHHGLRSPKRLCLQSISTSIASSGATNNAPSTGNNGPSSTYFGHQTISPFFNFASPNQQAHQQNSSTSINFPNNIQIAPISYSIASTNPSNANSIFSGHKRFKPISSTEIAEQIRDEMLRLRSIRRSKAKLSSSDINDNKIDKSLMESSPSSIENSANNNKPLATIEANSTTTSLANTSQQQPKAYKMYANLIGNSSANSSSSEDEENDERNYHHKKMATMSNTNVNGQKLCNNNQASINDIKSSNRPITNLNDSEKRLFTFNQVCQIVERLLRDKEEHIRQEYENILTTRLAEQYEQFVKFTYDQIQRRFDPHALPSYLS